MDFSGSVINLLSTHLIKRSESVHFDPSSSWLVSSLPLFDFVTRDLLISFALPPPALVFFNLQLVISHFCGKLHFSSQRYGLTSLCFFSQKRNCWLLLKGLRLISLSFSPFRAKNRRKKKKHLLELHSKCSQSISKSLQIHSFSFLEI